MIVAKFATQYILPCLVALTLLFCSACGSSSEPPKTAVPPASGYAAPQLAETDAPPTSSYIPPQQPATSSDSGHMSITSASASRYVGEIAEVCGPIAGSRYASSSNGRPTFLNFDRPYPEHTFVVLIWGDDRGNFPPNPEFYYLKKSVCVVGLIESYKGQAEIVVRASEQIRIVN